MELEQRKQIATEMVDLLSELNNKAALLMVDSMDTAEIAQHLKDQEEDLQNMRLEINEAENEEELYDILGIVQ